MKSYISSKLIGGLGNQLFSSSHAIAQGIKHNRDVIFLPKSYTPLQGNDTSHYTQNIFRNLKFVDQIENYSIVSEKSFEFYPVDPIDSNTLFDGYYQSSKHWYGNDIKIREIFSAPDYVKEYFKSKYPQIESEDTLSIHIRRSDYLNSPLIHPTVSKEYIEKSLKLIGYYSYVFIFSDDHNWIKENLDIPNSILVHEDQDWMELYLMSMCKNNIISNSTFSWWGSFLNENVKKKIIAPSIWFGPNGPNGKDIYEDYWTILDVEIDSNKTLKPKKYE